MLLLLACSGNEPAPITETGAPDTVETGPVDSAGEPERYEEIAVTVTLDGAPVEGAVVSQGGNDDRWTTDAAGTVTITVDHEVPGDFVVMAAHSEARIAGETPEDGAITIDLTRYVDSDNAAYVFQDPGSPTDNGDTSKCAHCHLLNDDWAESEHRSLIHI